MMKFTISTLTTAVAVSIKADMEQPKNGDIVCYDNMPGSVYNANGETGDCGECGAAGELNGEPRVSACAGKYTCQDTCELNSKQPWYFSLETYTLQTRMGSAGTASGNVGWRQWYCSKSLEDTSGTVNVFKNIEVDPAGPHRICKHLFANQVRNCQVPKEGEPWRCEECKAGFMKSSKDNGPWPRERMDVCEAPASHSAQTTDTSSNDPATAPTTTDQVDWAATLGKVDDLGHGSVEAAKDSASKDAASKESAWGNDQPVPVGFGF